MIIVPCSVMIAGYISSWGTMISGDMHIMAGWLFNMMPEQHVILTKDHALHRWSKHSHLCIIPAIVCCCCWYCILLTLFLSYLSFLDDLYLKDTMGAFLYIYKSIQVVAYSASRVWLFEITLLPTFRVHVNSYH